MNWFKKQDGVTKFAVVAVIVFVVLGILHSFVSEAKAMTVTPVNSFCYNVQEMGDLENKIGKIESVEQLSEPNAGGIVMIKVESSKYTNIGGLFPDGTMCFIWGKLKEGVEG